MNLNLSSYLSQCAVNFRPIFECSQPHILIPSVSSRTSPVSNLISNSWRYLYRLFTENKTRGDQSVSYPLRNSAPSPSLHRHALSLGSYRLRAFTGNQFFYLNTTSLRQSIRCCFPRPFLLPPYWLLVLWQTPLSCQPGKQPALVLHASTRQ